MHQYWQNKNDNILPVLVYTRMTLNLDILWPRFPSNMTRKMTHALSILFSLFLLARERGCGVHETCMRWCLGILRPICEWYVSIILSPLTAADGWRCRDTGETHPTSLRGKYLTTNSLRLLKIWLEDISFSTRYKFDKIEIFFFMSWLNTLVSTPSSLISGLYIYIGIVIIHRMGRPILWLVMTLYWLAALICHTISILYNSKHWSLIYRCDLCIVMRCTISS